MSRLIELHRRITNPLPEDEEDDNRLAIEPSEIRQIHVGKGGYTIITTACGKVAVEEDYEDVVAMKEATGNAF